MSSQLDAAIKAYRDDPSPENHRRLLELQQAVTSSFMRDRSTEYIDRTMERRSR